MQSSRGALFLSHAAQDKDIVDPIYRRLDTAITFYDIKTITPGERVLDIMRTAVAQSYVFILFHSPASLKSWVRFEKEIVEAAHASGAKIRILSIPIKGLSYSSLPGWMKEFMTTNEKFSESDIVRSILHLVKEAWRSISPEPEVWVGREDLLRKASLDLMKAVSLRGRPIQHILVSGIPGMGRKTFAAHLIEAGLPATNRSGPWLDLPDMAEALDVYLRLKEDLDGTMSQGEIEQQIKAFSALSDADQAKIILKQISHWAELNQVLVLQSRWGFRDRHRELKPWIRTLMTESQLIPNLRIIYISERRLPDEEIASLNNAIQYRIDELSKPDIEFILSKIVDARRFDLNKCTAVAERIMGHPATAHYVAYLANNGRSFDTLLANPDPIYTFQNNVIDQLFKNSALTEFQKSLIMLLGWFNQLPFSILSVVLKADPKTQAQDTWELLDYSLLQIEDNGVYSIPEMVAARVRWSSKDIDLDLFREIAEALREQIKAGILPAQSVEALLIALMETTDEIPPDLQSIVTPSALLGLVSEQFEVARTREVGAREQFEKIYTVSKLAMRFRASDDAIEQILFTGGDSAIRVGIYPIDIIEFLEYRGLPAVYYLKGSYAYYVKKDNNETIKQLKLAFAQRHFKLRTARLLTKALLRDGDYSQVLEILSNLTQDRIMRDSGLLITKIRAHRGLRQHQEANELEYILQSLSDDYGEISLYNSGKALNARDLKSAHEHLLEAKKAPRLNRLSALLMECAIQIEGKDYSFLPAAVEAASSAGRVFDAYQLRARRAVVEGDWREAEAFLGRFQRKMPSTLQLSTACLPLKRRTLL